MPISWFCLKSFWTIVPYVFFSPAQEDVFLFVCGVIVYSECLHSLAITVQFGGGDNDMF